MTHFGIVCPSATGHLNTLFPIGRELQRRGHRITVFNIPDVEPKALAADFNFLVIGESEFSPDKIAQYWEEKGKLKGFAALQHTIEGLKQRSAISLRDTPKAAKEAGVEALLVDSVAFEGGTIADYLNIPFISVCSAVFEYEESTVAPSLTAWNYNSAWWARLRNKTGYLLFNKITHTIREIVLKARREWNLPPVSSPKDLYSKLAIISQQPAEFEFPRRELPTYCHFTGPFHDSTGRPKVDFPFEKLNGKPLIYASMGTLQNRLQYVFTTIAKACADLDVQLVISLGGALEPETFGELPGAQPLIVKYAPQLELLQQASLTITHAGLNTTLESLTCGVPIIGIPITNDQPGVAARIAWTGTGEFIPLQRLRVSNLQQGIQKVLAGESYKQNALRLQTAIRNAGGVARAADIIETVVSTGQPVMNNKSELRIHS